MLGKGWKLTPLFFYTAVVVCLLTLTRDQSLSWSASILLLASGLLSWGLIEYGLHRFVFHYDARSKSGRKILYAAHLSHHEKPDSTDRIFASLVISGPVAGAYLLLAWFTTGSWRVAACLFTGLIMGYFYYEWLHFRWHHRRARLRLFRYLKKYHLLHHYQTPGLR
ncbi:MAG TPA: sterol desaturase family protein, partial [Pyrinomonadaceae bacterium]|nr:sterol desaturase family protein [Pyrinomonadaceae bacterium]